MNHKGLLATKTHNYKFLIWNTRSIRNRERLNFLRLMIVITKPDGAVVVETMIKEIDHHDQNYFDVKQIHSEIKE
jgi:hypothetical protein